MSRKAQIGFASFGLSALWGAAFFGAFVAGRLGQHPSVPAALVVIGCFCAATSGLLVTLACFPGLGECLRPVGQVAAVGAALQTVAILWTTLPALDRVLNLFQEFGLSNALLLPSMVALLASGILYFARWVSGQASRHRFEPMGAVQSVFLMLRRQHRLLGWLGLGLCGAHSVYYLVLPGPTVEQWSGIAATTLLVVLGFEGLITEYGRRIRIWIHRILAIAFTVAMAIHWQPTIPAATVLLLGVAAAGFLHLKLVSGLARMAGGASR